MHRDRTQSVKPRGAGVATILVFEPQHVLNALGRDSRGVRGRNPTCSLYPSHGELTRPLSIFSRHFHVHDAQVLSSSTLLFLPLCKRGLSGGKHFTSELGGRPGSQSDPGKKGEASMTTPFMKGLGQYAAPIFMGASLLYALGQKHRVDLRKARRDRAHNRYGKRRWKQTGSKKEIKIG